MGAASAVVVFTVVVVSMEEVSAVAVSTAGAFVVAVSMGDVSPVAVSAVVAFVVAVLVAATSVAIFAITDSLMMSSSATSAFRGGGAIRTDITVTTITRTITMDTATMDTEGMVTTVAPVMDTAMATGPVMDIAMAADQRICEVCGAGDKRGLRRLGFALLLARLKIPRTQKGCLTTRSYNVLNQRSIL